MKLKPVPSATAMWQDMDRQHPVTEQGQPVAYWEAPPFGQVFISPNRSCRPTACQWNDQWGVDTSGLAEGHTGLRSAKHEVLGMIMRGPLDAGKNTVEVEKEMFSLLAKLGEKE